MHQRAEMVKTAGSVACQEGGGSGWENGAQGRGDSRQEGSSQRWEETQTSGQGTRPQLCPLKAPGKGTKGLGWQVSPRVGKGPRQNLEKGGQQGALCSKLKAWAPAGPLGGAGPQEGNCLLNHFCFLEAPRSPSAASNGFMQVLPRWAEDSVIGGGRARGGKVAN